jgi:hypothetical protein
VSVHRQTVRSPLLPRVLLGLALGHALGLGAAHAQSAPAGPLSEAEAVAQLMFSDATAALPRTVSPGRVTYRGSTIAGAPERTILSVTVSRASPCLFEAFFAEGPIPGSTGAGAASTAYSATIDLRKLDAASLRPAQHASEGGRMLLKAKELFCSRSIIFEPQADLVYRDSCLDEIDDPIPAEQMARMTAAFETLRRACRW